MTPRLAVACLVLSLWTAAASAAEDRPKGATGALPVPAKKPSTGVINPIIDRPESEYLPDAAVLATVGKRRIQVGQFIESYFGYWPEFRPAPDSAGRVQFLNTLINKEVVGTVAMAAYHDETFEERIQMREHTERVLSNVLYQRMVYDSVKVEDAEARRVFPQYGYELQLRRLVFRDRTVATRVREAVAKGRMTWTAAAAEQGLSASGGLPEGDMGWTRRSALDPMIATTVFDLKPGQCSPVLFEVYGYTVYQAAGKRSIPAPAFDGIRSGIIEELKLVESTRRSEELLAQLRARSGLTHDTANIVWACRQFPEVITSGGPGGRSLEVDTRIPEFEPADTSRVLARFPDRAFTLGQFLAWYTAQTPYTRVSANTFPALRRQVDIAAMEPFLAVVARERGLDHDSLAVRLIEKRREGLRVERMFEDSIGQYVRLTAKDRRDYYQKNIARFMTYARVRYARIHRETQREADSIAAALRAGASAEAIVIADSVAGRAPGTVQWRSEEEHGVAYQTTLFGLREGQVTIANAQDGHLDVLQCLKFDPGHQLTYEESEMMIDEALQNIVSERLLDELIARHKRRLGVTAHPEQVMRIRLVDPTL